MHSVTSFLKATAGLSDVFLVLLWFVTVGSVSAVEAKDLGTSIPASHRIFVLSGTQASPSDIDTLTMTKRDSVTGPPPWVGTNVQVNDPQVFPFGRSETTLAASGNDNRIVVGWNDGQGFCGPPFSNLIELPCDIDVPGFTGYGYSSDGGETFVDGGVPPVGHRIGFGPGPGDVSDSGQYITLGDPALDVGGYGNDTFYYANLAEFVDQVHVSLGADPTAGVVVHSGRFKKNGSFAWDTAVLLQSPNYPKDFLDKEFIAADKRDNSEAVYVSVTNVIEVSGIPFFGFGQIETYASADGGGSWWRSIVQPDETISVAHNTGIINQGSQPAVGPDGNVYNVWERGWLSPLFGQADAGVYPQIRIAVSRDAGITWWPPANNLTLSGANPAGHLVANICAGSLFPPAGFNRPTTNDFPRLAVTQTGPHRGRVYAVWNDCRVANGGSQAQTGGVGNPDTDIYLAYSDDQGETWNDPVLVAGGGDGKIQFWPTVSIKPNGNIDITYYQSEETDLAPDNDAECVVPLGPGGTGPFRKSSVSSLVDLYYVTSTDSGLTFGAPLRVSERTSNWCSATSNIIPNFGDYNTAVSTSNSVLVTWADGRNDFPDVFFAKVFTAGR